MPQLQQEERRWSTRIERRIPWELFRLKAHGYLRAAYRLQSSAQRTLLAASLLFRCDIAYRTPSDIKRRLVSKFKFEPCTARYRIWACGCFRPLAVAECSSKHPFSRRMIRLEFGYTHLSTHRAQTLVRTITAPNRQNVRGHCSRPAVTNTCMYVGFFTRPDNIPLHVLLLPSEYLYSIRFPRGDLVPPSYESHQ